ncbi:helix-turn-helix transcriptional regulator [Rheinheimera sp. D18]|uniref:helix-turn-helix domain-containing protein n=1 Tax=Rheinheimera sp. D18 TaxID=2545632 RepID=UPI0014045BF5|nr:helix-turn-helix transcriptional regulator [Rheinheimera sp. D18]
MAKYITQRSKSDLNGSPKRIALGNWLREQREAKGLTMRDLSAVSGKPHSYFGKIEQAQRGLDVLEFIELCQWLDLNLVKSLKDIQSKTKLNKPE